MVKKSMELKTLIFQFSHYLLLVKNCSQARARVEKFTFLDLQVVMGEHRPSRQIDFRQLRAFVSLNGGIKKKCFKMIWK